ASSAMHVINYAADIERETAASGVAVQRVREVRRRALVPCLLSSSSTALGTLSLVWSEFSAIRDFGIFATIGVVLTFGVHILLLPRLVAWRFASRPPARRQKLFPRRLNRLLEFIIHP